jgi:hypothetical protein
MKLELGRNLESFLECLLKPKRTVIGRMHRKFLQISCIAAVEVVSRVRMIKVGR